LTKLSLGFRGFGSYRRATSTDLPETGIAEVIFCSVMAQHEGKIKWRLNALSQ
jgi:hypothetical protein